MKQKNKDRKKKDQYKLQLIKRFEKVQLRLRKILDVKLNFKINICFAHSRFDVELKKLQALVCKAYVKSIK